MQLEFAIMFGAIGGLVGGLVVVLISRLGQRKTRANYLYPKPTDPPQRIRVRKGDF